MKQILEKSDIDEVKSLKTPPGGVVLTMQVSPLVRVLAACPFHDITVDV